MSAMEWAVLAGGIAAIAWVNWYFFLSKREGAEAGVGGVQEVEVVVKGGYSPSQVRVRRGVPVRLVFDRQESSGGSEEVVIAGLGVRRRLPAFERTVVEFTPREAGTYEFTGGTGTLRGRIVVE
ncbi:MAG TPA: cupredoxin domain-containing protein [Longimicrobiales bacterium]